MEISRIYALHKFFSNRRYPVPLEEILEQLEISRSTFHLVRRQMCDFLGAPIQNKRGLGYFYDLKADERYELPGLWFSAREIVSLALLQQLNQTLQPAVVNELLQPISDRLHQLLQKQQVTEQDWQHRIKVSNQWQRV